MAITIGLFSNSLSQKDSNQTVKDTRLLFLRGPSKYKRRWFKQKYMYTVLLFYMTNWLWIPIRIENSFMYMVTIFRTWNNAVCHWLDFPWVPLWYRFYWRTLVTHTFQNWKKNNNLKTTFLSLPPQCSNYSSILAVPVLFCKPSVISWNSPWWMVISFPHHKNIMSYF